MSIGEYRAIVVFSLRRGYLQTPGRYNPAEDVAHDLVNVKRVIDPGDSVLDHFHENEEVILAAAAAMPSNRFACVFTIRGHWDYWGEYDEDADFELIPIGIEVDPCVPHHPFGPTIKRAAP